LEHHDDSDEFHTILGQYSSFYKFITSAAVPIPPPSKQLTLAAEVATTFVSSIEFGGGLSTLVDLVTRPSAAVGKPPVYIVERGGLD